MFTNLWGPYGTNLETVHSGTVPGRLFENAMLSKWEMCSAGWQGGVYFSVTALLVNSLNVHISGPQWKEKT